MAAKTLITIVWASMAPGLHLFADAPSPCPPDVIKRAVVNAFAAVHDGWSSDEVVLQDDLQDHFLQACREACPEVDAATFNWTLINLRKANQLGDYSVTKRNSHRHDTYRHAAEIAARLVTDRHEVSTDRMICDPKLRSDFDRIASEIAPNVDTYRLRKAAFGLRKSRRLRPELVVRVANWGREIRTASVESLREDTSVIPETPGVYLFRDATGYLYIGEAADLRKRLAKHLNVSDRAALANYLTHKAAPSDATQHGQIVVEMHLFPASSPASQTRMRRAYESELIASRRPRFNVRP